MEGFFDDPVARREIAGISRRRATYVLRAVYVGLLGALLWLIWKGSTDGRALSISEYADVGRNLFSGFYLFQIIFLSLAPTATAFELFYREVRTGAVDLLLLTPRSALSLTTGKWKAAMAEAAGYVLCGVPVLSACLFLGAIGLWELTWALTTSLLQAALSAAIAIRYASRPRPAPPRLGDAIATAWFWQLAPLLGFVFLYPGMLVTAAAHPAYAGIFALSNPDFLMGLGEYLWIVNLGVAPFVVRALLRGAATADIRLIPAQATALRPRLPRSALRAGVPEERPLLWKELRIREAGWALSGQRSLLLVAVTALAVLLWSGTHRYGLAGFAFVAFPMLLAALFNGAFLFHQEEDRRRWDLLLSTPLTPLRIVSTKLLAGLVAPESLYFLGLLAAALLGWGYPLPWGSLALLIFVVALFTLFVYLLSATAALYLNSRTSGGFFTAGLLFVLLAVVPWMRSVTQSRGAEGLGSLLDVAFRSLHPFAMLAPIEIALGGRFDEPGPPAYGVAFFAVYATAAALLFPLMVRRVARIAR